jgi:hypothetical protein
VLSAELQHRAGGPPAAAVFAKQVKEHLSKDVRVGMLLQACNTCQGHHARPMLLMFSYDAVTRLCHNSLALSQFSLLRLKAPFLCTNAPIQLPELFSIGQAPSNKDGRM